MIKLELFTKDSHNTKLAKGKGSGYTTIGLFLSPHKANSSNVNLCPFASEACISACLNTAGLAGIFPRILEARKRKSDQFLADRGAFIERLKEEIVIYHRRAEKNGKKLAVRLNGTSDIDFPVSIFSSFPTIQFYDYTKSPYKMSKYLCGNLPPNYHLTFSYSGENLEECRNVLASGGNVATVFSSNDFPRMWLGYKVKTGEESDLRFLDRGPVVIGLKAKGKAKKQTSSFIIQIGKGK